MSSNQFGKKGWTPEGIHSLTGKTFVITGANAGAGFEAAKILLRKNAEVIMLNRSNERSNEAIGNLKKQFGSKLKIAFVKMDLADLSSIREAANEQSKSTSKVDALICNVAVAQVAKQEFTVDGFESQLGINHFK